MSETGIDAFVASTNENVIYLSGYRSETQLHLKSAVYAMARSADPSFPILFVPALETGSLAVAGVKADVRFYGRYYIVDNAPRRTSAIDRRAISYIRNDWPRAAADACEALSSAIRSEGLSSARIGLDMGGLSTGTVSRLKESNPNARFVDASGSLLRMRMFKTSSEVGLLKRATRIAESAVTKALGRTRDGTTELTLATSIRREMTNFSDPGIVNAYFGKKSAYILRDHLPTPIARGDQVWIDVGCYYKGYCSDTGLTAVLGTPANKLRKYHRAILDAQRKAISAVRSGIRASDLYRIAVSEARKVIPQFERTHVGHGIGVGHYEPPSLSLDSDIVLEENMVINIETPYFEVGFGGLMVEDTLLVLDDGYEMLSSLDKELHQLRER